MSELKAFDVGLGLYTEDGYPCVVAVDADKNPRILNEKVYLKYEADKVIAELKAQKAQAEDDCAYWKTKAQMECHQKDKEISRLKRALYKACSNWAKSERYTEATWHGDEHREELWAEVQDKCLKKAEEYK